MKSVSKNLTLESSYSKRNFPTQFLHSSSCKNLIYIGIADSNFLAVCKSLRISARGFSSFSKYLSNSPKSELSDCFVIFNPQDATEILNHKDNFSVISQYSRKLFFPTLFTKLKSYATLRSTDFAEAESDGVNFWRWIITENSTAHIDIDLYDDLEGDIGLEFDLILPDYRWTLTDKETHPKLWIRFDCFKEEVCVNFRHQSRFFLPVPSFTRSVIMRSNVSSNRSKHDTRPLSFGLKNPRLKQKKTHEIESPSGIVMGLSKNSLEGIANQLHSMGFYFTQIIRIGPESGRACSISFASTGSPARGIHQITHVSNIIFDDSCIHWVYASSVDLAV
jgi:hypothetical protein